MTNDFLMPHKPGDSHSDEKPFLDQAEVDALLSNDPDLAGLGSTRFPRLTKILKKKELSGFTKKFDDVSLDYLISGQRDRLDEIDEMLAKGVATGFLHADNLSHVLSVLRNNSSLPDSHESSFNTFHYLGVHEQKPVFSKPEVNAILELISESSRHHDPSRLAQALNAGRVHGIITKPKFSGIIDSLKKIALTQVPSEIASRTASLKKSTKAPENKPLDPALHLEQSFLKLRPRGLRATQYFKEIGRSPSKRTLIPRGRMSQLKRRTA